MNLNWISIPSWFHRPLVMHLHSRTELLADAWLCSEITENSIFLHLQNDCQLVWLTARLPGNWSGWQLVCLAAGWSGSQLVWLPAGLAVSWLGRQQWLVGNNVFTCCTTRCFHVVQNGVKPWTSFAETSTKIPYINQKPDAAIFWENPFCMLVPASCEQCAGDLSMQATCLRPASLSTRLLDIIVMPSVAKDSAKWHSTKGVQSPFYLAMTELSQLKKSGW